MVVLATFDSEAGILRALRDGAAGFLLRSARRNELIKVVRLAADGHVVLSPDASRRLVSAATRLSGPATSGWRGWTCCRSASGRCWSASARP